MARSPRKTTPRRIPTLEDFIPIIEQLKKSRFLDASFSDDIIALLLREFTDQDRNSRAEKTGDERKVRIRRALRLKFGV